MSVRARLIQLLTRGRGRLAAIAALAIFVVLQLTLGGALFPGIRFALFDEYARRLPRGLNSDPPVVIVAIDDASLRDIGQWPWPRHVVAQLVRKIVQGGPVALGIDILWPEADRLSPGRWMQQEGALPPALSQALAALPDHDEVLRDALADGPVVIGIGGDRNGEKKGAGPLTPIRAIGGDPAPLLPSYDSLLRSLPALDRAPKGRGLITADPDSDGVIRRLPLLATGAGQLVPSLDLEILRVGLGAPGIEVYLQGGAITGVRMGELAIPTQADGSVWVQFSPTDPKRFVSAADVLSGRVPPDRFDHKLVLLGVTGLGLVDRRTTPLGVMQGSEIHAQFLENILAGSLPRQPAWSRLAEPGLTAAFGLLLIALLPALRLRWYIPVAVLTLAALGGIGFSAWGWQLWLVDVATPAVGDGIVFVALLGGSLAEADAQRRRLRRELELQRLAAAKLEGMLAAAYQVQMGMLPKPASLVPDRRFDLEAALTPALHVGGDLYDFFALDDDHLFVSIGDVSGKGLNASLFMALGKALCKSCALRGERDIGEIVRQANAEISRDNPESNFITLFAGILDLDTGELQFCNAGHDAPFIARTGQSPRQIDCVGGPPLCAMDTFPYMTERHQMQPGELLILVTDGVTEATNEAGELMGHARTTAAIHGLPPGSTSTEAITRLRHAVDCFLAGAALSDDLTLVALRWLGPGGAPPAA